jgi:hypothetical protein
MGGVGALKCICRLKAASRQGRCELAHGLDAESIISSSTTTILPSLFFLEAWPGPSKQNYFSLTIRPFGTHSIMITPLIAKKAIVIAFTHESLILAFFFFTFS